MDGRALGDEVVDSVEVGVDSPDDLVKNKLGEYGEGAKGWTSEDAKGFIKVSSTPLRAYYLSHPEEGKELEGND